MAKRKILKFSEKEFTMYNTIVAAAITNTIVKILSEKNLLELEDFSKIFNIDFVEREFKKRVEREIDNISKGTFTLEVFEYEEDVEEDE